MARLFAGRDVAPTRVVARPIRTEEEARAFLRLLPRYRVLLHRSAPEGAADDRNTSERVIVALLHVIPALSPRDAERIARQAHATGRAKVIVCLREQAEHYRAGLRERALVSTIELE
jgi:ATP-dependent Clp protease adapter protein ClpS